MWATQKLLGAPIISRRRARAGGGGGGSKRSIKMCPQAARNVKKWQKNGWFHTLIDVKIAKNAVFYLKVLTKIYYFEEHINLKVFYYLRRC